jgi:hypothetical protein
MKKLNTIHIAYTNHEKCQRQNRSSSFTCQGGSSNNLCRGNEVCNPISVTKACCQQEIIITLLLIFI